MKGRGRDTRLDRVRTSQGTMVITMGIREDAIVQTQGLIIRSTENTRRRNS